MNVLLFGPPGSGKGTQAADLAAALGLPHLATGDIFRRHLREGTDLGRLAKSYMDGGGLVPDTVTCDLVASRLEETDAEGGALFDGFPRSVDQARWLVAWLGERWRSVDAVINLIVPDAMIIERLSGRRTCLKCGATTHVTFAPPPPAGCAKCGSEMVQRPDDREETVRARLLTYARETAPVLAVLRDAGPVHDIDGVGEVGAIKVKIFAALGLK